ncbi:MAG TPA: phosphotransferase [Thermoanaerobaculia bacterium]|jgi:aminoglycoside phosphotransferase (APT) family kinase protein
MRPERTGIVQPGDPLHELLANALSIAASGQFEVYRLGREGAVYLYVHAPSGARAIGKFYGRKPLPAGTVGSSEMHALLMNREFYHLQMLRSLGFDDGPHRVPRPLATSETTNWLLIEEFVEGESIHHAVRQRIERGDELLDHSITSVATALVRLHGFPCPSSLLPPKDAVAYFAKVISQLQATGILSGAARDRLLGIAQRWHRGNAVSAYEPAMIHGDATPEHFLYHHGTDCMNMIDVEALRLGNPAEDLGYLAGELKHLFWMYTDDPWASEPAIRRMYDAYIAAAKLPSAAADALTEGARYFMGVVELRIARNTWLPFHHRLKLIAEAERCFQI